MRIFQDCTGEIKVLNDKCIEQFLCIQSIDDETGFIDPCLFWLKLKEENNWHRFSVDDILCAWSIYQSLDETDFEDGGDFPSFDMCKVFNLKDLKIDSIKVFDINGLVHLLLKFYNSTNLLIEYTKNDRIKITKTIN
ncbi:MAG: hypothetical protein U0354_13450 [Candidatus Sericytochromatia bacterium]